MPSPGVYWPSLAVLLCVALGAGLTRSPFMSLAVLGATAIAFTWVVLGPETIVALALMTAVGLVPFVNPDDLLVGTLPLWAVAFAGATIVMFAAWAVRTVERKPELGAGATVTLVLAGMLLAYTTLRLLASEPLSSPDTTARISAFAPAVILGFVAFSQRQAIDGFRRALPVVVGILVVWGVAYVAAATIDCGACLAVVQSDSEREGLAGGASRLYTAGQDAFTAFAVVAVAAALVRPSPLTLGLAALGVANVAVQATRAQYLAFGVAAIVLLIWRFRESRLTGRLVLALGTAAAIGAIAMSAVGDRAVSGYEDLRNSSGNAGYRIGLLDRASQNWSLLGHGVGSEVRAGTIDFHFDLGISNTIVALGFVGAALQLGVLLAAVGRGLRAGGLIGIALAAALVLVLVGRPSLPLLEYGPSAVAYGLAVGAVCALPAATRGATRSWR